MASGKKNYFRHNFNAHEDPKIMALMEKHGLAGYAMFFILLELCARQCENEFKESVTIARRTLRQSWRKVGPKVDQGLADLQAMLLLGYTSDEQSYNISIPNLSKYMGKYESKLSPNSPNKRKEKEIKEKESKVNTITPDDVSNLWNNAYGKEFGYCHGFGGGKHLERVIESVKILDTTQKWDELFTKAMASKFLKGDNPSNWKVGLYWLINYDNALRVLADEFNGENVTSGLFDGIKDDSTQTMEA